MTTGQSFQFHKGTIKTFHQAVGDQSDLYFNSIKVRLKHDGSEYVVRLSWIFQFHKGTIKTFSS